MVGSWSGGRRLGYGSRFEGAADHGAELVAVLQLDVDPRVLPSPGEPEPSADQVASHLGGGHRAEGEIDERGRGVSSWFQRLSLIHISEPTRLGMSSYAVF